MHPPRKPWWQQATALVSLGTGGAITGFAFAHGTPEHLASPSSVPVTLTALDQAAQPAAADGATEESVVRSAIVKVASYYAKLAQSKTPAEMEALIWQQDSRDGGDHGQSCAAFASMTLQLGAQLAGKQSWVTGGSTYPWPLHDWADARVDPNSGSLDITSIVQDAQSHQRWHAIGDGYGPEPGDWVLFDQHVEVVTGYSGGVLSTIGGDSLPNFSVNAHEYSGSLSSNGVQGFVDNGDLPAVTTASVSSGGSAAAKPAPAPSTHQQAAGGSTATPQDDQQAEDAVAAIPGTATMTATTTASDAPGTSTGSSATSAASASIPGVPASSASPSAARPSAAASSGHAGTAAKPKTGPKSSSSPSPVSSSPSSASSASIPGMPTAAGAARSPSGTKSSGSSSSSSSSYQRHPTASASAATSAAAAPGSAAQRAFISQIAPGALAAQRTYGVPAAVTIAQAIDESAWGQSSLASEDHNLFGIKGTGPAGSVSLPTQEVYNGQAVSTTADFRVYNDVAESIEDHGKLLASSGSYTAAMANQQSPNAFANALTGVYATDPNYGSSLISLMRQYNLYRYDASAAGTSSAATSGASAGASSASPAAAKASPKAQPHGATQSHPASKAATRPSAKATSPRVASPATSPSARASQPVASPPTAAPSPTASASGSPGNPAPVTVPHPFATPSGSPANVSQGQAEIPGVPATGTSTGGWGTGATGPANGTGGSGGSTGNPSGQADGAAGSSASSTGQAGGTAASPGGTSGTAGSSAGGAGGSAARAASGTSGSSSGGSGSTGSTGGSPAGDTGGTGSSAQPSAQPAAQPAAEASTSADVRSSAPGTDSAPATDATLTAVIQPAGHAPTAKDAPAAKKEPARKAPKRKSPTAKARRAAPRYQPEMPTAVKSALLSSARKPLARAELVYRDVAASVGLPWKILAACDWMQCDAHPRYSPVRGEKLGTVNPDGTVFHTKSEALTQTARDLVTLADAVYEIDLSVPVALSVLELANVFAAYRWGGLLRQHRTSAMEFPYSVQGLTDQFTHMRWPRIADPNAPDKPGSRYRRAFGAVPVVLSLDYPAIVL